MSPLRISENEFELKAIRSGGPGGQNVNKVATAIQLRFDSQNSSLPDHIKERLLKLRDQRINSEGVITITARQFRNQEANRLAAIERLGQSHQANTSLGQEATRNQNQTQSRKATSYTCQTR